jgi:hypothetical protein
VNHRRAADPNDRDRRLRPVGQGSFSFIAVGTATLITPPYTQLHFDVEVSAGKFATITVGAPGTHGATVVGVHGPGVNTPSAAAVSEAVAGLVNDMHTPNIGMFMNGLLSMMFAIGFDSASTLFIGVTMIGAGDAPNEHIRLSPITTGCDMPRT